MSLFCWLHLHIQDMQLCNKSLHIPRHRELTTSYWAVLTARKLPYRIWEGEERSMQKHRPKAFSPQLPL